MWAPCVPVTSLTPLEPILSAIGFGLQDLESYATIADKFKARSVNTVGDLFGTAMRAGSVRNCSSACVRSR